MQPDMADSSEANQMMPNTGFDISQGMMSVTGWNDGQDFGAMAQFMPNTMGNFQNPMGMSTFLFHLQEIYIYAGT